MICPQAGEDLDESFGFRTCYWQCGGADELRVLDAQLARQGDGQPNSKVSQQVWRLLVERLKQWGVADKERRFTIRLG